MASAPIPTKPGFYWAKWRIAEDDTADNGECCPGIHAEWEVVEVFENTTDCGDPQYLMVFVPGVAQSQSLENFFWSAKQLLPIEDN